MIGYIAGFIVVAIVAFVAIILVGIIVFSNDRDDDEWH